MQRVVGGGSVNPLGGGSVDCPTRLNRAREGSALPKGMDAVLLAASLDAAHELPFGQPKLSHGRLRRVSVPLQTGVGGAVRVYPGLLVSWSPGLLVCAHMFAPMPHQLQFAL